MPKGARRGRFTSASDLLKVDRWLARGLR